MCLAIPAEVIEVYGDEAALVDFGGVRKIVSTTLLEKASVGDYVIVHVGFALSRLDPAEAEKTLRLIEECKEVDDGSIPPDSSRTSQLSALLR